MGKGNFGDEFKRAREDARQTELISKAWRDSGKIYGYRKLHDDLLDHGETSSPNRVAHLANLAGIKAPDRLPASVGQLWRQTVGGR